MGQRLLIATTISLLLAGTALATPGGQAEEATRHPGRLGYLKSDGEAYGTPIRHLYARPGFPAEVPFPYPEGPGGWGGAVSELVSECGGFHGVHDPGCVQDPD